MFPDRISRIASMLQEELSRALTEHQEALNHLSGGALFSLTRVTVTRNLEEAVAFYSWLNLPTDKTPKDFEPALKEIFAQIIPIVCRRVVLRRFPKIAFQYDPSLEGASRVYEILDSLKRETK